MFRNLLNCVKLFIEIDIKTDLSIIYRTLMDCTNVNNRMRMLTLLRSNLISLAALNNLKKPMLPKTPVASIILPTTVIKSKVFQESLK